MRKRAVRSALLGPLPWWDDLFPPPPGYRFIYLTSLTYNVFALVDGGHVAFPSLFAAPIPRQEEEKIWEWYRRRDAMIDEASDKQKPGKWVCPSDPFWKGIETVAQFCTDFWWEKTNKPRTPCKIAITSFGESAQVTMNDEEKGRSSHTTAATVRDALELLDAHLKAGTAPWRYWKNKR